MSSKKKPATARKPKTIKNLDLLAIQREKLLLKEKEIELMEGLPFLHGWKWYSWAREFYESTNKLNFLCAANQISKSSTQIRKCINWATDRSLWPKLWGHKPTQFWYLYPSTNQVSIEFETKWKQFLPRGKYKEDPIYGWKEEKKNKETWAIHFRSGVHVYFKTYSQDIQNLQTGTVDAIFADEEVPTEVYDELIMRISASDGYYHQVFTATLGQEFWRQVIEPKENEEEKLPEAWKRQVSMYDCQLYEDGTPSRWTTERIAEVIARCKSQAEVLRRVWGKFVVDSGRKYQAFEMKRHMIKPHEIDKTWHLYAGVDHGSGGEKGHPAAIVMVAVRPDYKTGRVFNGWRGDGIETTASDVILKFREMKGDLVFSGQYYDWASKEFEIISTRMGEPFMPADKGHDRGEGILNTLFKNDMIYIFDTPELQKLGAELATLQESTSKRKAKDDFIDSFRYSCSRIPWDWSHILSNKPRGLPEDLKVKSPMEVQIDERRKAFTDQPLTDEDLEAEFEELNELYG